MHNSISKTVVNSYHLQKVYNGEWKPNAVIVSKVWEKKKVSIKLRARCASGWRAFSGLGPPWGSHQAPAWDQTKGGAARGPLQRPPQVSCLPWQPDSLSAAWPRCGGGCAGGRGFLGSRFSFPKKTILSFCSSQTWAEGDFLSLGC